MERFTGGCLCGDVRIVASGLPYRVGVCHCLDCRKHHGALFHASAIFPADAVTIAGAIRDFEGRCFCPRCGSTVFGRTADEIEVNLGSWTRPISWCRRTRAGPSAASPGCRRFRSRDAMSAIAPSRSARGERTGG